MEERKLSLGKALEIFVKQLLICIGFSEVKSDGLYVYDSSAGQMVQGLGSSHNADVLLEPPVQTPFYIPTRLIFECKDHTRKTGLATIRGALGLREDINHFEIVDKDKLISRKNHYRTMTPFSNDRYAYQVAVASITGYTKDAQLFAATHRIPLLEFDRFDFWERLRTLLHASETSSSEIKEYANEIGKNMAVAVLKSGQLLFLHQIEGDQLRFADDYTLHWSNKDQPWQLCSGGCTYMFSLPEKIMKLWIENTSNELELKRSAIHCKEEVF